MTILRSFYQFPATMRKSERIRHWAHIYQEDNITALLVPLLPKLINLILSKDSPFKNVKYNLFLKGKWEGLLD